MGLNHPKANARTAILLRAAIWATITIVLVPVQARAASVGEAEVRRCVEDLFRLAANGQCSSYFSLKAVRKVDARETGAEANVIADIDFLVIKELGGSSSGASQCTGNSWKIKVENPYPPNSAQWLLYQSQGDMSGGYLKPGRGLRVRKNFKFEKWESGWRCAEQSMSPLLLVWDDITIASDSSRKGSSQTGGGDPAAAAGKRDQQAQTNSKDTVTYTCERADKPDVKAILVVDLSNRTVRSPNAFGGLGAGVSAEITDAKIVWKNSQKKNYGMGGTLNFSGSIDRATRDFSFKGADNRTYLFKCR
jgi:hypothetical protein